MGDRVTLLLRSVRLATYLFFSSAPMSSLPQPLVVLATVLSKLWGLRIPLVIVRTFARRPWQSMGLLFGVFKSSCDCLLFLELRTFRCYISEVFLYLAKLRGVECCICILLSRITSISHFEYIPSICKYLGRRGIDFSHSKRRIFGHFSVGFIFSRWVVVMLCYARHRIFHSATV